MSQFNVGDKVTVDGYEGRVFQVTALPEWDGSYYSLYEKDDDNWAFYEWHMVLYNPSNNSRKWKKKPLYMRMKDAV